MKVIDARSGKEMKLGERVNYPEGEWMRLIDVEPGLFSATATVQTCMRDESKPSRPLAIMTQQVPLTVRWMHPRFFLQHVAFLPS